jgi:hypothetical protein
MVLPIYRRDLLGSLPPFFLVTISSCMYIRQRTLVLLSAFIWAGSIILVLSVVRSMELLLGSGDWRMLHTFSCDCVYFALDSHSLRKLTVAFNAFVRYVYQRRLFDHITNISDSMLGCSLLTYLIFRLACFMFSFETGGRPLYSFESLVFSRIERTFRINRTVHRIHGWFCFGSWN